MANRLAILVGSVSLVIIAALLFHGHGVKSELRESNEDYADEKLRSKRAQRQNLDYESRIRDLEVALRQKTEQQSNVQAELDEAEQQVTEKTEFVKEVQASLDEMATQFGIALEAGEAVATTAIRTLTERVGEQIKVLRGEVESLQQKVSGHEANADAVVESKEVLKKELDDALAKVAANSKELTGLRNDFKKVNAVVQALLLSDNASTVDLQKQADEAAKKIVELDKKIASTATKAPATTAPTAAPTTAPPAPAPASDDNAEADKADVDNTGDDTAVKGYDNAAPQKDGDAAATDEQPTGSSGGAAAPKPKPKPKEEYDTEN